MRVARKAMSEINVVPYIDVMLVLLVIFMITAPLLSQGVSVELPKASAKTLTQQTEPIVVSINATGQYFLNIADNPEVAIDANFLKEAVSKALGSVTKGGETRSVFVKVINTLIMIKWSKQWCYCRRLALRVLDSLRKILNRL